MLIELLSTNKLLSTVRILCEYDKRSQIWLGGLQCEGLCVAYESR